LLGTRGEIACQRGLADSGLTADERETPAAGARAVDQRRDRGAFRFPADETRAIAKLGGLVVRVIHCADL
jgi:hypothetical protein